MKLFKSVLTNNKLELTVSCSELLPGAINDGYVSVKTSDDIWRTFKITEITRYASTKVYNLVLTYKSRYDHKISLEFDDISEYRYITDTKEISDIRMRESYC